MTSATIFDKVARRELTPEQGAAFLMAERERERAWAPAQPGWMPRWVYVLSVLLVSIVVGPLLVHLGADHRG